MKQTARASALLLLLGLTAANPSFAQEAISNSRRADRSVAAPSPAAALASEVRAIANSSSLSIAKKEKHIANAVRVAVVAATAYKSDSAQNLEVGLELATAAANAAPRFTEVIANAVSFTPAMTRIDGASGQIRAAAFAAANPKTKRRIPAAPREEDYAVTAPKARRTSRPAVTEPSPTTPDEVTAVSPQRQYPKSSSTPSRHVVAADSPRDAGTEPETGSANDRSMPGAESGVDSALPEYAANTSLGQTSSRSRVPLSGNSAAHVTANVSLQHDDNVYLQKSDKTSDQTLTLTPGVNFAFGQNSLTHGSLSAGVEFLRYLHHTAPNATLGQGSADFGYSDEKLKLSSTASYNQSYQNTRDVITAGGRSLFQTDTLGLGASGELAMTANTSVGTGATYNKTSYHQTGLVGSKAFSVPVNVYYKATPKVDLSLGLSYQTEKPENSGPGGHDLYYNVGVRGSFTPKLSGNLSVGYRKRHGDNGLDDSQLGFSGSFDYELTPKSTLTLGLNRDFSTGALGESLQNSSYSLKVATAFNPQWQASASVNYRRIDYGQFIFRELPKTPNGVPIISAFHRQDDYWEGSLGVSYLFSSWLTTSASYVRRSNSSSITGVDFSNNLLSLMVGLQY